MKNNKKRLTKAEMRVVVAKDALKQIEIEQYLPRCGTYTDYLLRNKINYDSDHKSQMQDVIKDFQKDNQCSMCARGTLLISTIRKYNKVTVGEYKLDWEKKSIDLFGKKQLESIERCFERWEYSEFPKESKFIKKYQDKNDSEMLKVILRNIIRNNGIFKP